jgi:hypothetical protein
MNSTQVRELRWPIPGPYACREPGCTEPQRLLLRYRGGVYVSDWCWEHSCTCLVCGGSIDDGEDFCGYHAEALRARYEAELPVAVARALHAQTHPLQTEDDPANADLDEYAPDVAPRGRAHAN